MPKPLCKTKTTTGKRTNTTKNSTQKKRLNNVMNKHKQNRVRLKVSLLNMKTFIKKIKKQTQTFSSNQSP